MCIFPYAEKTSMPKFYDTCICSQFLCRQRRLWSARVWTSLNHTAISRGNGLSDKINPLLRIKTIKLLLQPPFGCFSPQIAEFVSTFPVSSLSRCRTVRRGNVWSFRSYSIIRNQAYVENDWRWFSCSHPANFCKLHLILEMLLLH